MTTAAPDLVRPVVRRTLGGFAELVAVVGAGEPVPAWLANRRQAAAAHVEERGLPGAKDEEWRFTSLHGLAGTRFVAAQPSAILDPASLTPFLFGDAAWGLLVIVDGRVDQGLSRLPADVGVACRSLADALRSGDPVVAQCLGQVVPFDANAFTAINTALCIDGAVLHVAAGAELSHPLHIVHVTTSASAGSVIAPRTLVVLGAGASATVVESFVSLGAADRTGARSYLLDACAEITLGEGARLEHIRIQRESRTAWHVGFTGVHQERNSRFRSFTLALGGRLARHDLHARLGAPAVETLLYGLYLGREDQLVDNHTAIYHDHPDGKSWEVYKGVLTDRSHGVFNGKVIVQPVAQRTDAKQTNRNLLLSDTAKIDTKPQLEIFADDVRCTHGATVGRLDEQQRFYLRARGIAGREAELMLIAAFVAEVLVEIEEPRVRSAIEALVHAEVVAFIGSPA